MTILRDLPDMIEDAPPSLVRLHVLIVDRIKNHHINSMTNIDKLNANGFINSTIFFIEQFNRIISAICVLYVLSCIRKIFRKLLFFKVIYIFDFWSILVCKYFTNYRFCFLLQSSYTIYCIFIKRIYTSSVRKTLFNNIFTTTPNCSIVYLTWLERFDCILS